MFRLLSLWLLASALSLLAALMLASPAQLHAWAGTVHAGGVTTVGERASLFVAASKDHWWGLFPFLSAGLLGGALVAITAWVLALKERHREAEQQGDGSDCVIRDRFGGEIIMVKDGLDHEPVMMQFPMAETEISGPGVEGITSFERDALNLLVAHDTIPADVGGHHDTTLLNHTLGVWQRAVALHGAGSLPALLAISHDLGKIASYQQAKEGWIKINNRHEQMGLMVARTLPGILALEEGLRQDFIRALTILCTRQRPHYVPAHIAAAISAVKALDIQTTVGEKEESAAQVHEVDVATVVAEWEAYKGAILRGMNINKHLAPADPFDGLFRMDKPNWLFVTEIALRKHICGHFSRSVVHGLRLDSDRGASNHPALPVLLNAIADAGDLIRQVDMHSSPTGLFSVRSARVNVKYMICIEVSGVGEEVKNKWGDWPHELDVRPFDPSAKAFLSAY